MEMDWDKRREEMSRISKETKDIPISRQAILVAKGFQVAAELLQADKTPSDKEGKGESA